MGKLNCEREPVDVSNPRKLANLLREDGFSVEEKDLTIIARFDTASLTIHLEKPSDNIIILPKKSQSNFFTR